MEAPLFKNQFLDNLRLEDKEKAIYIAALELGETLQLPLAEKAGVKRTTLREILPDLFNRGILERVIHGKRNYIVATSPQVLFERMKEQTKFAEQALPELLAIKNQATSKPRVTFYEGIEGLKEVYEQTLKVAQPIYSFIEVEAIDPRIQSWLTNDYTKRREQKKIKAFNIVNTSDKLDKVMAADEFRENKIVSNKEFPFRMEILAFGDYVAFINFRETERPSATLIQSQATAITMRSIHQLFWK